MLKTTKFQRGIASSIVILSLSFLLTLLSMQLLVRPGWIVYDWFQKTTALPSTSGVAMILVDQHTLDQLEKSDQIRFPFPRQLFGLVNAVAAKIGARGVIFDILFTEASSYGPEDDANFAKLIQDSKVPTFLPAASEKGFVKDPVETIRRAVTGLGGVHFKVESDGVVRKAPPYLRGANGEVMSLPEAAYQALGKPEDDKEDTYEIAPAERLLRFYKPNGIPYLSFYDLVIAYRALENGQDVPADFKNLKDRVLVVGYSAPGLHDLKPIPTDNEAPGMLVPATALANRIDRVGIRVVGLTIYLGLSFIFIAAMMLLGSLARTPKLLAALIGVVFPALIAGTTFAFWRFGFWLNPFPLGLGVFAAGVSILLLKFFTYWAEGRKFAKSLSYSMSPELVNLIRSGQLKVERYGEQREISILFCDIVGFSKLSEKMDPRQLVTLLNRYSDAAVELIFNNNGYVDKFIGDAVMAFWGAPIPQDDHASRALGVAIAYATTMERFNQKLAAEFPSFPGLKVRVGLHTGSAIVGNIGAKNRHNYTAIGDGVNLASRLESLAKLYDCFLLMSENTVHAAKAEELSGLLELDHVIVRGRTQSTRIYTYLVDAEVATISEYKDALSAYYQGEWQTALSHFEKAAAIPTAVIMAERCRRSLKEGPLKEWNQGVWYHEV